MSREEGSGRGLLSGSGSAISVSPPFPSAPHILTPVSPVRSASCSRLSSSPSSLPFPCPHPSPALRSHSQTFLSKLIYARRSAGSPRACPGPLAEVCGAGGGGSEHARGAGSPGGSSRGSLAAMRRRGHRVWRFSSVHRCC